MASARFAKALLLLLAPLPGACGRSAPAAPLVRFRDAVQVGREITLSESPEVLNVRPRVAVDPWGGFIVADPSEHQVRLYAADGRLRGRFGRRGRGPGEFDRVAAALRSPSGELLAFEMDGRLTVFDPGGTRVLRTENTTIAPLYRVALAGGDRVVIAGRRRGQPGSELVHVWDFRRAALVRSFFRPVPPTPGFQQAYLFSGFSDVAVRSDTVAVLFALSDTVYLFGMDGRPRGNVPLPFAGFRRLRDPMPDGDAPRPLERWIESFSTASHLFWRRDGSMLVQFFDTQGSEAHWRLLGLGRTGHPLFEIHDGPKLLALTGNADSLIFNKPGSDAANVWTIAEVRK